MESYKVKLKSCEMRLLHAVTGRIVVHAVKAGRERLGDVLAILRYKNS